MRFVACRLLTTTCKADHAASFLAAYLGRLQRAWWASRHQDAPAHRCRWMGHGWRSIHQGPAAPDEHLRWRCKADLARRHTQRQPRPHARPLLRHTPEVALHDQRVCSRQGQPLRHIGASNGDHHFARRQLLKGHTLNRVLPAQHRQQGRVWVTSQFCAWLRQQRYAAACCAGFVCPVHPATANLPVGLGGAVGTAAVAQQQRAVQPRRPHSQVEINNERSLGCIVQKCNASSAQWI